MKVRSSVVALAMAALLGVTTANDIVDADRSDQHGAVTTRPVATASEVVTAGDPKPLPTCGDVNNCFDCFLQQECAANPFGGDPICSPCGWCASNSSKASWSADVKGECVMAPIGIVDFCQLVDPGADRYCPETVCKVGDWGCACKDNMFPAVEKLIGIFTIEGLYIILFCVMSFGVFLATMCMRCAFGLGPRRIVVVHQYPSPVPYPTDVEQPNSSVSTAPQTAHPTPHASTNYTRFD